MSDEMLGLVTRARALLGWAPTITPAVMKELHAIQSEAADLPRSPRTEASTGTHVPLPTYDDPRFDAILQRKKEFREHAMVPGGSKPDTLADGWRDSCDTSGDFSLTELQLILRNFIAPGTPYNGCLLHHGVGLGKSCSAVTVAESFPDKQVLVLTSPGLQEAFARQVFDPSKIRERADGTLDLSAMTQCTGRSYIDRILNPHLLTRVELGRRIRALVAKRYTFMGLDRFANVVDALGDDPERMRKQFSNYVIVVDEAHHLRNNVTGTTAKSKKVTTILRRVLSCTENVKLLLLTATPMFNDSRDIVDLLNLLLVNDKRRPLKTEDLFDRRGGLTKEGSKALVASARGYVSYMPGGSPYSFPRRLPDVAASAASTLPTADLYGRPIHAADRITTLRLTCTPMSATQRLAYSETALDFLDEGQAKVVVAVAAPDDGEDGDEEAGRDGDTDADADGEGDGEGDGPATTLANDRRRGKAIRTGQQILNVVFPVPAARADKAPKGPGAWATGRRGFLGCFKTELGKDGAMRVSYRDNVSHFLAQPLLAEVAPKISSIVKTVLVSTGVTLCYSRFVWSGAVPLAIALEHAGLERYGAPNLLKMSGTDKDILREGRGRGSYIIVTGSAEVGGDADAQIAAARATSNVDGADIRVVIVTTKASEGVDLRFVRAIHILEPWYNLQRLAQIIGRASRHCSHALLPAPKRNFTLFLHACTGVPATKARGTRRERETLDLRAYRISESKQGRIDAVQRLLMGGAFDCALNRTRIDDQARMRTMATDVEDCLGVKRKLSGPLVDGFQDVVGVCDTPLSRSETDSSTYDLAKHAYGVDRYKGAIRTAFKERSEWALTELEAHAGAGAGSRVHIRTDFLALVLTRIMEQHELVQDGQGRSCTVRQRGRSYVAEPIDDGSIDTSVRPRRRLVMGVSPIDPPPGSGPGPKRLGSGQGPALAPASAPSSKTPFGSSATAVVRDRAAAMAAELGLPTTPDGKQLLKVLEAPILDAVLDRLPWLMSLSLLSTLSKGAGAGGQRGQAILRSLRSSGFLVTSGEKGDGSYARARDGKWYCCGTEAEAQDCDAIALVDPSVQKKMSENRVHRSTARAALVQNRQGVFEFRLLNAPSNNGKGTICSQTSASTLDQLKTMCISTMADAGAVVKPVVLGTLPKKRVCLLYELSLRLGQKLARPAQAHDW